jgi:hypothetical protein
MATLGNATTPAAGWKAEGSNGWSAASSYTMPPGGGVVTSITGYFDAATSGKTGYLCVWNNSGTLLLQSSSFTLNVGSFSAGGQDWWTKSISNVYVPAGTIWIGFYTNGNLVFSSEVGGSSDDQNFGTGGPGSFSGHGSSGIGTVGAQITYTPLSAPTISSATPNVAGVGGSIAVVGTQFTYASAVTIGGASASFSIVDDSHITATVPSGATPGLGTLVVTNPAGTGSIAFTVGTIEADNGGAWATGVTFAADDGSTWHTGSSVQVWADDGAAWHQIG